MSLKIMLPRPKTKKPSKKRGSCNITSDFGDIRIFTVSQGTESQDKQKWITKGFKGKQDVIYRIGTLIRTHKNGILLKKWDGAAPDLQLNDIPDLCKPTRMKPLKGPSVTLNVKDGTQEDMTRNDYPKSRSKRCPGADEYYSSKKKECVTRQRAKYTRVKGGNPRTKCRKEGKHYMKDETGKLVCVDDIGKIAALEARKKAARKRANEKRRMNAAAKTLAALK
jgi:hypothetical protein